MELRLNKKTKISNGLFLAFFFYVLKNSMMILFLIIEFYMQGNRGAINFVQTTSVPEIWAMSSTIVLTLLFAEFYCSSNPSRIRFDQEQVYIRTAFRKFSYNLDQCSCTESKFLWSTYYTIEAKTKNKSRKIIVSNLRYRSYHDFFTAFKIAIKYYWYWEKHEKCNNSV